MTRSETKRNWVHAWTYSLISTLTLPWICCRWLQKRSNIKEIETWKVADRLWNGTMTKKWPMLKANSVQSECRSSHMVIWINEIPTRLHLFWQKGNNMKSETILEKNKVSVKAGKMMRKVNEKVNKSQDAIHPTPWCSYPRNHHCSGSHLRTKSCLLYTSPSPRDA